MTHRILFLLCLCWLALSPNRVSGAVIGNFVWNDLNADGVQSAGEPGLDGMVIELWADADSDGAIDDVIATATTDNGGIYQFSGVAAGNYKLRFIAPVGWNFTRRLQQASFSSIDSNADADGLTAILSVAEATNEGDIDAGMFQPCSIGNFVWEDMDGNGVQNPGETGIKDVSVVLTGTAGSGSPVLLNAGSGIDGSYLFSNLTPGTYKLTFTPPANYISTAPKQGADDTKDSDVNPATGMTGNEILISGENNTHYDAGYFKYGAIGNFVWDDTNSDGKQGNGESGLPFVSVNLFGATGAGQNVNRSTQTDTNGLYRFSQLAPGFYQVQFVSPPGYAISPKDRGTDDALDSDGDPAGGSTLFETLTSGEENLYYDCGMLKPQTFIKGYVRNDQNGNCQAESGEQGLGAWLVKATRGVEVFYTFSAPDGSFTLYAPPGVYTLDTETPQYLQGVSCSPLPEVDLLDSSEAFIPVQQVRNSPVLTVDLSTPLLRRCFESRYAVRYCNMGAGAAENAYIDITLDSFLTLQSASIPYSALGNHQYRFPAGNIAPFECRSFELQVLVGCDAVPGQAHCSQAHIFPDSFYQVVQPQWTGAKIESFAHCLGNTLRVVLKNTGTGAMSSELEYVIIEDGVMGKPVKSNPLPAGDSLVLNLPGNGSTWRVEAKQEATYTGWSAPVLSVEGCTNGSSFSTGFVQQFPLNDAEPAIDLDCTANVGSYDPNDKQGMPIGYGPLHYIEPRTEMEYLLRFQNTGTDTAFTVYLLDTLSPRFDLRSLRPGPSSHPYKYELSDNGILKFDFPNIRLPQKAVNEAASQGFVRYSISLRADNPLESAVLNRAGIYFDFNPPVITNTTQHRIGLNFVSVSIQVSPNSRYQAIVQPNPFKYHTTILLKDAPVADEYRLRIFSAAGRLVYEQNSVTPVFPVDAATMAPGLYFFSVFGQNQLWSTGKVVVTRE